LYRAIQRLLECLPLRFVQLEPAAVGQCLSCSRDASVEQELADVLVAGTRGSLK
jgi:hypothetical protein